MTVVLTAGLEVAPRHLQQVCAKKKSGDSTSGADDETTHCEGPIASSEGNHEEEGVGKEA